MATGDLTTLANATAWAGSSATASLVTAASTQIQSWLCYRIASQSYTRAFNGTGGASVMLPDRPVTAVSSLTIDGTSVLPSAGAAQPGFVFDAKTLYLIGGRFSRGLQNIAVTYTAGYAATPADIEQACLILIKATIDRASRDDGLLMQKAGDIEFRYASPVQSGDSPGMLLPPDVLALIGPYRRVAPC